MSKKIPLSSSSSSSKNGKNVLATDNSSPMELTKTPSFSEQDETGRGRGSHSNVPNLHRCDLQVKMLMIGSVSVGKTNIMMRFAKGRFNPQYSQTIGLDFQLKSTKIDGKKIQIQIWDTSGQERFKSLTQSYYRGANAVFIVYDITNKTTYNAINDWIDEVQKNTSSEIQIVIIGNKSDLTATRAVSYEEASQFANSLGMKYYETSAKLNTNIDDVFLDTAMDVYYSYFPDALMKRKDTIEIVAADTGRKEKIKKKKKCC